VPSMSDSTASTPSKGATRPRPMARKPNDDLRRAHPMRTASA